MKIELNNLDIILPYLVFDSSDDFYFLQIIKRRKENPDMSTNSRTKKSFYISSKEHLYEKFTEIRDLCNFYNARAYIDLNKKSYKKVAFLTLGKLSDYLTMGVYKPVSSIYNSACGECSTEFKKWIIDIDDLDPCPTQLAIEAINKCDSKITSGENVLDIIPTLNGYHLLTLPFNSKQLEPFQCKHPLDVHKSATTLLYY